MQSYLNSAMIAATIGLCAFSLMAQNRPDGRATTVQQFRTHQSIVLTSANGTPITFEGFCEINRANVGQTVAVFCKTGPDSYVRHYVQKAAHIVDGS